MEPGEGDGSWLYTSPSRTQMKQMCLKHLSFDFWVHSLYIGYKSVPILDPSDGMLT